MNQYSNYARLSGIQDEKYELEQKDENFDDVMERSLSKDHRTSQFHVSRSGLHQAFGTLSMDSSDATGLRRRTFSEHERSDIFRKRKRTNRLRKHVFKKLIKKDSRAMSNAKRSLSSFISTNRKVLVSRLPREHYAMEQTTLLALELLRYIKNRSLAYDHIREGIENLFYLHDFFMIQDRRTPRIPSHLANLLSQLLVVLEEITPMLELMAKQRPTDWSRVRDLLSASLEVQDYPFDIMGMVPPMDSLLPARLLGAGGFGSVYKATLFGEKITCTAKLVPLTKFKMPKHACADKVVASMTNNRFLVKYYATCATQEAFLTIMEYIRGIDLHRLIKVNKGIAHDICQLLLAQLGEGLQHMHRRGCIHRDIKPSNMMVLPGCQVKLIDFDTVKICIANFLPRKSKFFGERSSREFTDRETAGTVPFFAPEVLTGSGYGRALDWWAVGVTAFNLAFGMVPFKGNKKDKEFRDKVTNACIPYPKGVHISAAFRSLIDLLLEKRPGKRMCSLVHEEWQRHPFFQDIDWDDLRAGTIWLDLPAITEEMEFDKETAQWSPKPPKPFEKCLLELEKQQDSEIQSALYTYTSSGFQRCLETYRSGRGVNEEEILDVIEDIPPRNHDRYRFEKLTVVRKHNSDSVGHVMY